MLKYKWIAKGIGFIKTVTTYPNLPGTSLETAFVSFYIPSKADTDGDRITDNIDICPNTPIGEIVGTNGCKVVEIEAEPTPTIGQYGILVLCLLR